MIQQPASFAPLRQLRLRARAAAPVFAAGLTAALLALGVHAQAHAAPLPDTPFQFGVIGHSFKSGADEAVLKRAIAEATQGNPAFVVATGIKAASEPCTDRLYAQRQALLNEAPAPLIVALAGSDWAACLNSAGRSNAVERLNHLRDLLFPDSASLGARRLTLTRLSGSAKFRSYAENAHWEYGQVLFATINLPAKNNHFRAEAGRNSEYEDRLVANRAWLHRLFALAERRKLGALVLFSDGDIGLPPDDSWSSLLPSFQSTKQDGFAEPRRQIKAMAEKFEGKVLLIDTQGNANGEAAINWRANLGHLSLGAEPLQLRYAAGAFSISRPAAEPPAQ